MRKQQPAKIVVAVPEVFYSVGHFYEDFTQVSDQEVTEDLKRIQDNS